MGPRTPSGLAAAVLAELKAWDDGRRDALATSQHWAQLLHAPRVAERILGLAADLTATRAQPVA